MIQTLLECGHLVHWRTQHTTPRRGARVYCYGCDDMRAVVGQVGNWQVRCRHCRFDRAYIEDSVMQRAVRRHLADRADHIMVVGRIGGDQTWQIQSEDMARTLF